MSFIDTIRLALGNLGQAKLRTALTVLGVSIGIASLSGMVSLGVGLEDQIVGRFTQSGMFDSITVTTTPIGRIGGMGGRGRRGGNGGRGAPNAGRQTADGAVPDLAGGPAAEAPRVRLDDDAIAKMAALPHVKDVHPNLRVPLQVSFKDYSEITAAAGVPMSSASEGAFQSIAYGAFFANDQDDACMLSLDLARRLSDLDPKDLIGQSVTLTYAVAPPAGSVPATAPLPGGLPGIATAAMQVQRVELSCPVVGIVERESVPGLGGGGAVSPLMIPLAKARAIDAVQVTNAQALLRRTSEPRAYTSVTVKVSAAQRTQDVEDQHQGDGVLGVFAERRAAGRQARVSHPGHRAEPDWIDRARRVVARHREHDGHVDPGTHARDRHHEGDRRQRR